jgi:hypothetical protein
LNAPHCHKSFTRKKAKLQEITTWMGWHSSSLMARRVDLTGSEEKCWKRKETSWSGKSQSPVIKKSAVNVMQWVEKTRN